MWLLKDCNGKIKYLQTNKIINIGRKEADIILENDLSISRAHATITVILKNHLKTSEVLSKCIVKDTKSKYGTTVIRNNVPIKVTTEGFELQPFDILKFGLQQHIFTAEYTRFITVISRLSADHKKQLKKIIDNIGGIIVDCYDDNCTHLTATTAQSTNKIISALIIGLPIIDINYWIAVEKAIEVNDNLPDPNSFIIQLQDKGINTQRVSLKPNTLRKILFQGKTFIFFSEKICKEYKKMINEAGGKVKLESINSNNITDDLFADNNIIMQITDDDITDELAVLNAMLYDKMQEKKLRMIAETEIPLAIVYVSLDQYCNPKYLFKELVKRKSFKKDTSEILALDTQDIFMSNVNTNASVSTQVLIPDTDDFLQDDTSRNGIQVDSSSRVNNKKCEEIEKIDEYLNNEIFQKSKNQNVDIKNTIIDNAKLQNKDFHNRSYFNLENRTKSNITNEFSKAESSYKSQNFDSINFESLSNTNTSISMKQNEFSMALESIHSKKRQREQTDDKSNKNLESGWKSKVVNAFDDYAKKKRSVITGSRDDFVRIEKQKTKIQEEKKNKLAKWGFKKSEKETIDFDLDDLDMDKPKEQTRKNYFGHSTSTNKETLLLEKINKTKNVCDLSSANKVNRNLQTKTLNLIDSKLFKENVNVWTLDGLLNFENHSGNYSMIKNENKCLFNPNIKLELNNYIKNNKKVFKKGYYQIPQKRIALSDMTIWRPTF